MTSVQEEMGRGGEGEDWETGQYNERGDGRNAHVGTLQEKSFLLVESTHGG